MTIKLTNTTTRHEGSDKVITTIVEEVVPHHVMILRLHDQIMEAGPHHFDMQTWFNDPRRDGINDLSFVLPEYDDRGHVIDFTHCGTTGCLAGHTAVFARHNGVTDLISSSPDYGKPTVDQDKVMRFLGVPWGVFSSEHSNWHPATQAAFRIDIATACHGIVWLANDDQDEDEDVLGTSPVRWQDVAYSNVETERIVDDGDILDSWEWTKAVRHHAEWVAACAYLRYLAMVSEAMFSGSDTDIFAVRDVECISLSPAWTNSFDNNVEF